MGLMVTLYVANVPCPDMLAYVYSPQIITLTETNPSTATFIDGVELRRGGSHILVDGTTISIGNGNSTRPHGSVSWQTDRFDADLQTALKLICHLTTEAYRPPKRRPRAPSPPQRSYEHILPDDELIPYVNILKVHRDKPFVQLTTEGLILFLGIVTSESRLRFIRFEHPDSPAAIYEFSNTYLSAVGGHEVGSNDIGTIDLRPVNACDRDDNFQPQWNDLTCKVYVGSELEKWEPVEDVIDYLMISSMNAVQRAAHYIPGILSVLTCGGMGDIIFKFLTNDPVDKIQPQTDLQKYLLASGMIQIEKVPHFVADIAHSGDKMFPSESISAGDLVKEYGSFDHFLSTEPIHNSSVQFGGGSDGPMEVEDIEGGGIFLALTL
jgi:hypothetical protein